MHKVLVLGGPRFFGRDLVQTLIHDGHDVTIATRGRTKDDFGDRVNRLIVERNDRGSLMDTFAQRYFDIVIDNLCYSPNAARIACDVFDGKVGKYIFTSTISVYEQGVFLKEKDFDPYHYKIRYGEREAFAYGEGKRLAEAVLFQKAAFPVTAVRFPVVIGKEDYTGRLRSYFERINGEIPFYIDNLESQMSFITARQAGNFLGWIAMKKFCGPINACCEGAIKTKDIIRMCEIKSGKQWFAGESICEIAGAFNGTSDYTLDSTEAKRLGYQFEDVIEAVEMIIREF